MAEDILKGKDVLYLMEIKLHKDKPEIVISNPNQIQESIKVDVNRSSYEVVRRSCLHSGGFRPKSWSIGVFM